MSTTTRTVTVDRPIFEVFDYLVDATHAPEWQHLLVDSTPLSTPAPAVGVRYRQHGRHPLGFRVSADVVVTDLQRPGCVGFRVVSGGPIRPTMRFDLAPLDDRTRVTLTLHTAVPLLGGWLGWQAGGLDRARTRLERTAA